MDAQATLGAQVPPGWTVTAVPAAIPLAPAASETPATVRITVPAGAKSGLYPVAVTVRGPHGAEAKATVTVPVFGSWTSGTTASASSEHAPNVVGDATRTYVAANAIDHDLATFWNDDTAGQYPDTLTVTVTVTARRRDDVDGRRLRVPPRRSPDGLHRADLGRRRVGRPGPRGGAATSGSAPSLPASRVGADPGGGLTCGQGHVDEQVGAQGHRAEQAGRDRLAACVGAGVGDPDAEPVATGPEDGRHVEPVRRPQP